MPWPRPVLARSLRNLHHFVDHSDRADPACSPVPHVNESLSLSSSPVSGVSLFHVQKLPLSPLSLLKHALPTRLQSPPLALHPHSSHPLPFRSPRYPPISFFFVLHLSILILT